MTKPMRQRAPDEGAATTPATATEATRPPSPSTTHTEQRKNTKHLEILDHHLETLDHFVTQYSPPVTDPHQNPHIQDAYPAPANHTQAPPHTNKHRHRHTIHIPTPLHPANNDIPQTNAIHHLINALSTDDHNIKTLIRSLQDDWSSHNAKGTLITRRHLL